MKKTDRNHRQRDEMRPEYALDYSRARPNRFASRLQGKVISVVLEPDVAEVFSTSESVNRLLRAVISAAPIKAKRASSDKTRRKTG
jgi:hypothetical protein